MEAERKKPLRVPAVAGRFYPGDEDTLRAEIMGFIGPHRGSQPALGIMMPHAGYVYSGMVAGGTVSEVPIPRTVIVLGPNHTGRGPAVSVFPAGTWRMPFGDVPVDEALAGEFLERCSLGVPDETAHLMEHSIEVQVPFLFYGGAGNLRILPVTLSGIQGEECRLVGEALGAVVSGREDDILLVASSDMTHYESQESARIKDSMALSRVLDLDPDGLLKVVSGHGISMCGVIPTAVMLHACLSLGAREGKLVRYATSGDVSGDYRQVVGYAGVVVR